MHRSLRTSGILILIIFTLYVLTPILLFLFAKPTFTKLLSASYFFLLFAFFLIISPFGKIRIGSTPRYKTLHWLLMIFGIEIILYLLFFSFTHTVMQYIPATETLRNAASAKFILQTLAIQYGFYPWTMYAILAAGLGYIHYCKNQLPLKSSLLPVLQDAYLDTFFKRMAQILLSVSSSFIFFTTIGLLGAQIALLFSDITGTTRIYAMTSTSVLLGIVFLFTLHTPKFTNIIQFLCRYKVSVGLFFLMATFALGIFFIVLNLLAPLLQNYFARNKIILLELPLDYVSIETWQIAIGCWWLGWATLAMTAFMHISYGRRIRDLILAVMILPIIVSILGVNNLFIYSHPILLDVLALIGPLTLIMIFMRSHHSGLMTIGFVTLPENSLIAKPRATIKFIIPVLRAIVWLGLVYMWTGLTLTSATIAIATFSCLFIYIGFCLLFYRELYFNQP